MFWEGTKNQSPHGYDCPGQGEPHADLSLAVLGCLQNFLDTSQLPLSIPSMPSFKAVSWRPRHLEKVKFSLPGWIFTTMASQLPAFTLSWGKDRAQWAGSLCALQAQSAFWEVLHS